MIKILNENTLEATCNKCGEMVFKTEFGEGVVMTEVPGGVLVSAVIYSQVIPEEAYCLKCLKEMINDDSTGQESKN